jgi:hypothetical protein
LRGVEGNVAVFLGDDKVVHEFEGEVDYKAEHGSVVGRRCVEVSIRFEVVTTR